MYSWRRLREAWDYAVKAMGFGPETQTPASSPKTELPKIEKGRPGWLKLEFSKAADSARIHEIFKPEVKQEIDPHGYVVKRAEPYFGNTIASGGAAFLKDSDGTVQTLTMAYRTSPPGSDQDEQHHFTETGTTITRIGGYSSAQPVIAALTLKEWWENPPRHLIVAEIKKSNIPSVKTFRDFLGWEPVMDQDMNRKIGESTDQTVSSDEDKSIEQTMGDNPVAGWYSVTAKTIRQSAEILLKYLEEGKLVNKKTGHEIRLDLGVLDEVGLTRERLEAMAGGMTDRAKLAVIGPPPPSPAP